jgi:hypothetical protein
VTGGAFGVLEEHELVDAVAMTSPASAQPSTTFTMDRWSCPSKSVSSKKSFTYAEV